MSRRMIDWIVGVGSDIPGNRSLRLVFDRGNDGQAIVIKYFG